MNNPSARGLAAALVALMLYASAAPVFAQSGGFVFEEDEVEPMEFTEDEVDDIELPLDEPEPMGMEFIDPSVVTALIVPGDAIDAITADRLTAAVEAELAALGGYTIVDNTPLREEFEIMGSELAMECAFDPVCIGRYGRELGIGRVVVGRVNTAEDGAWATTLDLFDTEGAAIVNYRYFQTEAGLLAVEAQLPAQLPQLFGVRQERPSNVDVRTGPSTGQRVAAWSTAILAVGSVGAGVAFGLQARQAEQDLRDCTTVVAYDGDPVCEQTQRSAGADIDDGKRSARLSNVFLGTGLMLGVVSTVLFTVTPGSDIDESAATDSPRRTWAIAPNASPDGLGFTGAVGF